MDTTDLDLAMVLERGPAAERIQEEVIGKVERDAATHPVSRRMRGLADARGVGQLAFLQTQGGELESGDEFLK
jgi:hypothetical protein